MKQPVATHRPTGNDRATEPSPHTSALYPPTRTAPGIHGLLYHWTYHPERLSAVCYLRRWRRQLEAKPMPKFAEIKAVEQHREWIIYFVFAPDGQLDDSHLFTLDRLKAGRLPVLAVVASKAEHLVPEIILKTCDAVYWKALSGYDFSAYAVGLHAIGRSSPGADALVFNDSVYGPFSSLEPFVRNAPWDFTGFMATDGSLQRHIQSYAFIMRNVTIERLESLGDIFSMTSAFDSATATICCRELWMARTASRTMSVGSFWFGEVARVLDPTLSKGLELLDAGFPFVKKSLLNKQRHYQQRDRVLAYLERLGHPLTEAVSSLPPQSQCGVRPGIASCLRRAGAKKLLGRLKNWVRN